MPFALRCPSCQKMLMLAESIRGMSVLCLHCGRGLMAVESGAVARPGRCRVPLPLRLLVHVARDPEGKLRGLFEGVLTRAGLRLRQGVTEVVVPVGCGAEHLKENAVALTVSGRRVEVLVTRPGAYPQRLAGDVASYLAGDGNLVGPEGGERGVDVS